MADSYRSVVIAIDGAEESDFVLERLDRFIDRVNDRCHVVTVIPPLLASFAGIDPETVAADWPLADLERAVTNELTRSVRERVARFGISPDEVTVRHGRASVEICAFADEIGADLIILGSQSPHGVAHIGLGTTANEVVNLAGCDVLTIKLSEGG